jgi:hypothetical protein
MGMARKQNGVSPASVRVRENISRDHSSIGKVSSTDLPIPRRAFPRAAGPQGRTRLSIETSREGGGGRPATAAQASTEKLR